MAEVIIHITTCMIMYILKLCMQAKHKHIVIIKLQILIISKV
jgi:hypothetical protein